MLPDFASFAEAIEWYDQLNPVKRAWYMFLSYPNWPFTVNHVKHFDAGRMRSAYRR